MSYTIAEVQDTIFAEWTRVPMMPSDAHFERSWANILERARDRFGADRVDLALSQSSRLASIHKAFGKKSS